MGLPVKPKLNEQQRKQLIQACGNNLNWSDGGHWIGNGSAPRCFTSDREQNSFTHKWLFQTDQAANKWNTECERNIRYIGHLGTAALAVAVGLATGGAAGIAAGTIAGVVKDELQAKIWYPKMFRGWSYELTYSNTFNWSAHPWGQRNFKQEITGVIRDHQQKITEKRPTEHQYSFDELPERVARMIVATASKRTQSTFT